MGKIHDKIRQLGKQGALIEFKQDTSRLLHPDRSVVELAAAAMTEERMDPGYVYSGFCLVFLPHRNPSRDDPSKDWVYLGDRCKLVVQPGKVYNVKAETEGQYAGVPFGPTARMILLYLQSEAVRGQSREVELGASMAAWLEKMGISAGGKTYRQVRDQARRIARCNLHFVWGRNPDGRTVWADERLVESGLFMMERDTDPRQSQLFPEAVTLGTRFFEGLRRHAVPVWGPGLGLLSESSAAIDIYLWLAYRLHVLDSPVTVPWTRLHRQFGKGYARLKNFKPEFAKALKQVLAIYEEAHVTEADDGVGIVLHPSRPPIARQG